MTPCARGCCWTPWQACAQQRTCACHWDDRKPAPPGPTGSRTVRRPTEDQAIRNVMREARDRRKP